QLEPDFVRHFFGEAEDPFQRIHDDFAFGRGCFGGAAADGAQTDPHFAPRERDRHALHAFQGPRAARAHAFARDRFGFAFGFVGDPGFGREPAGEGPVEQRVFGVPPFVVAFFDFFRAGAVFVFPGFRECAEAPTDGDFPFGRPPVPRGRSFSGRRPFGLY